MGAHGVRGGRVWDGGQHRGPWSTPGTTTHSRATGSHGRNATTDGSALVVGVFAMAAARTARAITQRRAGAKDRGSV